MCFNGSTFNGLAGFVMRSMLAATLMFAAATGASAQMTTPATPGTKPKPVQTVPIRLPHCRRRRTTANAMAQAERLSLQSDLAWVGQYNGAITGDVSARMVEAIKEYPEGQGWQADRRAQSAGARCARRDRAAQAGERRLENRDGADQRRPARHPRQTGAAAGDRRQRLEMDFADRHGAGAAERGARRRTRSRRNSPSWRRRSRGARSTTPW